MLWGMTSALTGVRNLRTVLSHHRTLTVRQEARSYGGILVARIFVGLPEVCSANASKRITTF